MCLGGEGNGTPLQYSCLESPMDGGAWWAAVHGVVKSRTWLTDFTFTFHFRALEKEMATHSSVLAWRIPGMGGAWWAAVYGVTQSRTRLKQLSSSMCLGEGKPRCDNHWTQVMQLLKPTRPRACLLHQREASEMRRPHTTTETSPHSSRDPVQPKQINTQTNQQIFLKEDHGTAETNITL